MRLTLRNMLAYLDGILESEDAEDIAKKIEESKYATDLMHRIRDLMRRLRLAAPSVSAQGPGLDPNTVAEYLDNTLPPDRVVDFEKICLESDIHLAEVAACHQILSLVLGEPMEIDPAARQRMYEIQGSPDHEGTLSQVAATVSPPPLPTAPLKPEGEKRKPRVRPVIPEYLREPRKKRNWLARCGVVVGAACVLLVLLAAFGQLEPGTFLGNFLVQWNLIEDPLQTAAASEKEKKQKLDAASQEAAGADAEKSKPSPIPTGEETEKSESPRPNVPPDADDEKQPEGEPPPEEKGADAEMEIPPSVPPPTESDSPEGEVSLIPLEGGPLPDEVEIPIPEMPEEKILPPSVPTESTAGEAPDTTPPEPAPSAAPSDERMGRLMSEDQILLSPMDGTTTWQRVPAKELLGPQRPLLALPTYRPEIALSAGLTLRLLGSTRVEFLQDSTADLPGLQLRFGRVVLMPLAKPGVRIRLVLPERSGIITFGDADTVVAAEVRRILPPGTDPEGKQPWFVTELFLPAGRIQWAEESQTPLEFSAPTRFLLEEELLPSALAVKEFPPWITAEPISQLDRRASEMLREGVGSEAPAKQSLLEFTEHRQKEVRWLAVRCLGYLGFFDPMVTALGDPAAKPVWDDNIEQLRAAVVRDADTAAAVRQALEKHYAPLAAELYRMLWGYTNQGLAGGDAEDLVQFLDHENLAMRVLSFWNLKEITNLGLYYRPEDTEAKRRQRIQRWRQRLEAGEIRYRPTEEEVEEPSEERAVPPSRGKQL